MFIVLGATGHVGSAVAGTLLEAGERVTVVTRSAEKAARWRSEGAEAAVVDVRDADALRAVFRTGTRAFLVNPPADTAGDTDAAERATGASIARAVQGSGLEKIVAQSTYGAHDGGACGDLTTLHAFEDALLRTAIPTTVLRAAYYMSNWDGLVDAAREGSLPTLFPADFTLPMVAQCDLGRVAARLLREPAERGGIHHVEGPERYTPQDAADAFAAALGRPVTLAVTPEDGWQDAFRDLGFSSAAAASYACMTAATVDGAHLFPAEPERGVVTLDAHIRAVCEAKRGVAQTA